MASLYSDGSVQALVEKLLPFGMALDANGTLDAYIFDDHATKIKEVTSSNICDFVNKNIIGKYQMGGTNYAPIINMIVKDFGGVMHDHSTLASKGKSWLEKAKSALSGGSTASPAPSDVKKFDHPVYVAFVTDGDCGDKAATRQAMINASYNGIFFQFIGIGGASFGFLQELDEMEGRLVDNANFQKATDINAATDDHLYDILMKEYPGYPAQARKLGLIV